MFTNRITKLINGLPGWPYWDGLSASSTGQCRNAYTATGAPASGGAAADRPIGADRARTASARRSRFRLRAGSNW
jgi:hypothetical protein